MASGTNIVRPARGVALITAMLVVAIAATVGTAMALHSDIWLRKATNARDRTQAEAIRIGAEHFAAWALRKDARESKTDDLSEAWAQPQTLPIDNGVGVVSVQLTDAHGRFNLNNLVKNDQPQAAYAGMFRRLLELQSLSPDLAEATIDWIDANSQAQPNGAEDIDYLGLTPPYRSANRPFDSVDELRLVKGFKADMVDRLRPFLTALPSDTAININTASATVLAAMYPAVSVSTMEQAISARDKKPFNDVSELKQLLPADTPAPQIAVAVTSSFFYLNVETTIGRVQYRTVSLLKRPEGDGPADVLWHAPPPIVIKRDDERNDHT